MTSPTNHHSEHQEQIGFVNWFRSRFPHVLIYAIPNGEKRALSVAKRLKAEGVTAGMPDLHVPKLRLWVEMKKTKGGRLSPEQREVIEYLERIGDTVIIGFGAEDASRKLLEFLRIKMQPNPGDDQPPL